MIYNKSKATKRFSFNINRNTTAKKAGSNTVTIATREIPGFYSSPTASLTMTVKEARALYSFLDSYLIDAPVVEPVV